jgi:hypothetical protein
MIVWVQVRQQRPQHRTGRREPSGVGLLGLTIFYLPDNRRAARNGRSLRWSLRPLALLAALIAAGYIRASIGTRAIHRVFATAGSTVDSALDRGTRMYR